MPTKDVDQNQTRPPMATPGATWFEAEPGVRFKVLVSAEQTGGSYAFIESIVQKGAGSTLHIHHHEGEHFLVLEGTVRLVVGDKTFDVPAGQTITVPRGIPHAWSNESDEPLRFVTVFSPGGFDQLCIEMATASAANKSDIRQRYGLEIVGPKPGTTISS
jgi:mannose-6-phosphate isomerase-like protein (cupin superfamily)